MEKIIGGILIMISSISIGIMQSGKLSKRIDEIREVELLFHTLDTEIRFFSSILRDAFSKMASMAKTSVGGILCSMVTNLENHEISCASQAWQRALEENFIHTSLSKEENEVLSSFGKSLGNSDLEGQLSSIRSCIKQLENLEKTAMDRREKNSKLYLYLGIIGGLSVWIVLL